MNIALISLLFSILLSGCEEFGMFIIYPLVSTYKSITNDEIEIRGSCPNLSEGQAGVRIVELDEPGLFSFPNDFTQRISISRGQHVIGIKLGHISKIQKLTLQFSSKHRYLLSATFNKSTNKYQAHFWDECFTALYNRLAGIGLGEMKKTRKPSTFYQKIGLIAVDLVFFSISASRPRLSLFKCTLF